MRAVVCFAVGFGLSGMLDPWLRPMLVAWWSKWFKVTPPMLPTPEARGIGIIMRPVSEDAHADQLRDERLMMASEWLKRMPKLPPNCASMTVEMHYDDGKFLSMRIREAE